MIDFTDEHKVKAICAALARVLPDHSIFWPMASGGQGLVVYTHHGPTNRNVAVKVLDAGLLTTADARRRFDLEIRALGRLHHDHIVRVYDSGSVGDLLYFTMEHIPGVRVTDWRLMYEPAPAAVVQRFLQVARALAHAHRRGVIHRDIKPGNILIDDSDAEHHGRACVVDFGMAKLIEECDDGTRSSSMQHVG
ncbi:MAG: serine/threonine-protein kinase, partial [Planctomycetota bacterium]|nr:serine/threonine-protein kinase [Planctomycetota bacterium]